MENYRMIRAEATPCPKWSPEPQLSANSSSAAADDTQPESPPRPLQPPRRHAQSISAPLRTPTSIRNLVTEPRTRAFLQNSVFAVRRRAAGEQIVVQTTVRDGFAVSGGPPSPQRRSSQFLSSSASRSRDSDIKRRAYSGCAACETTRLRQALGGFMRHGRQLCVEGGVGLEPPRVRVCNNPSSWLKCVLQHFFRLASPGRPSLSETPDSAQVRPANPISSILRCRQLSGSSLSCEKL
ncbi:hypothetical protein QBC47DRAFT_116899 [Echria macrotheca]|uniref:Uncharacterized protein n=1 Tax=Echria macrotheca TaxID=438768 RepID=A0AAJ0FG82_9PEZI|nr:hypothetical protein QBC47DRAFT_116899 [Echria macrotheca]